MFPAVTFNVLLSLASHIYGFSSYSVRTPKDLYISSSETGDGSERTKAEVAFTDLFEKSYHIDIKNTDWLNIGKAHLSGVPDSDKSTFYYEVSKEETNRNQYSEVRNNITTNRVNQTPLPTKLGSGSIPAKGHADKTIASPKLKRHISYADDVIGQTGSTKSLQCPQTTKNPSVLDYTIDIAVLVPMELDDLTLPYSYHKVLPAVQLAVNHLKEDGLRGPLQGWSIALHYRDTNCSSTHGPLAAVDLHFKGLADVFLGPVCEYVLSTVTRFATVWDTPVLTPGGHPQAFNFKESYKTLTRLRGFHTEVGQVVKAFGDYFSWSLVGLLYEDVSESEGGHSTCRMTLSEVHKAFRKNTSNKSYVPGEHSLRTLIEYLKDKTRIIVLCAQHQNVIRDVMMTAKDLEMTNGDFAFINIDLFSGTRQSNQPWFDSSKDDNEQAKEAYQALLTITATTPHNDEYKSFSKQVYSIGREDFNYSYPNKNDLLSPYVASFYEAVILYARALNASLEAQEEENLNVTAFPSGQVVLAHLWNKTQSLITGDVSINSNGDRSADYSILDLDPQTNKFQVVGVFQGEHLNMTQKKQIHWPGGSPPKDTPECGFKGELCKNYLSLLVIIVLCFLVVIMLLFSVFVYRHYKLEADIARMTWRIDINDVIDTAHAQKRTKFGSRVSLRSIGSAGSNDSVLANKQMFISTGIYKGAPVAIKRLKISKVELTRPLLLELKQMKDLQSEHLVRFYGACLEPVCAFFTEYCPRGSLQDVLEEENLTLDHMFKYSLMHDIVKGMCFLHSSEIKWHGNLKSTNCVVDSRFVLKLTDFGLHSLRVDEGSLDEDDYAYWRRLLWTSPEILRNEVVPVAEGMQRADVYAFSIIVHEITYRKGSFYVATQQLEPTEIIEKVKLGNFPLFRPSLEDSTDCEPEVINMMKKCWAEEPLDRPDFRYLKNLVRKLNKSNESGNILDNLLSRMEQYANNLESLVQERTADYLEEKRKCEELLYQLLPKSVARQLIAGGGVMAETFDCVTIYFSDIVGFTSLSAASTPMQVVDLLNDLYSIFDSTIEDFDVYKVETIGDAYMVVSGLPERNGNCHVREIARMSLSLLNTVKKFQIRHRPDEKLKLRIGIHSGPCVAGVVGVKMPRYCLFGDTVNTSSRMESNGLALKIHVSSVTYQLLTTYFPSFELELRGQVEMKGKGLMTTYWLLGETIAPDGELETVPPNSVTSNDSSATGQLVVNSVPENNAENFLPSNTLDSEATTTSVESSSDSTVPNIINFESNISVENEKNSCIAHTLVPLSNGIRKNPPLQKVQSELNPLDDSKYL